MIFPIQHAVIDPSVWPQRISPTTPLLIHFYVFTVFTAISSVGEEKGG